MATYRFNYIITIHNKEELIERVLTCVLMCARDNSHIYPVLDGCTDNTEKIIDDICKNYSNVPVTKVFAPDVHELLAINAGLLAANQNGDGFNIVLQDDILLAEYFLEQKIITLYEHMGAQLGYVSFRFGANFAPDAATSLESIPFIQYAENACARFRSDSDIVLPGQFTYRHIPIKSPVCIPFKLVRELGVLEARLAPYAHDDTDYAIRCLNAGYRNGVFAVRFLSELDWGGTRQNNHVPVTPMLERNIGRIRDWHRQTLPIISSANEDREIFEIYPIDQDEKTAALATGNATYSSLKRRYSWQATLANTMRNLIGRA